LKITDQIAYVDFSEEIRSKHPGGSAGELMTLNSIVNSLTELPEIKKVQIMINGKKVDTLVGHADLSQPLGRDESIIKK
jgi:spore germination protein GerM